MCCGQKRNALNINGVADTSAVKLMYHGNGSAQIRGQATGQIYQFARTRPVQSVDARDVGTLVRTRLFTQVR